MENGDKGPGKADATGQSAESARDAERSRDAERERRIAKNTERVERLSRSLFPLFLVAESRGRRGIMLARLPYDTDEPATGFVVDESMDRSKGIFPAGAAEIIEAALMGYRFGEEVPIVLCVVGENKEAHIEHLRVKRWPNGTEDRAPPGTPVSPGKIASSEAQTPSSTPTPPHASPAPQARTRPSTPPRAQQGAAPAPPKPTVPARAQQGTDSRAAARAQQTAAPRTAATRSAAGQVAATCSAAATDAVPTEAEMENYIEGLLKGDP